MRRRLATLLALGILAGGLVSVVTSIATPQPAAACTGEDCGRASIELYVSQGPYRYGKPIQMYVEAKDTSYSCLVAAIGCAPPSGTIEIYEDGVGPPIATEVLHDACPDDGNCDLSYTRHDLYVCCIRAGRPQLLYKYIPSGADPFEPTERVAVYRVESAPTETTLTASPSSSVYGEPVTLTAQVSATVSIDQQAHPVTSYVNFKYLDDQNNWQLIAGAFVENGVATLVTKKIPLGGRTLRAEYETDGDYAASTDLLWYSVGRGGVTNTLTQSSGTTVFGEPFTLTSTVTPVSPSAGVPTGDVAFKAGGATLGTATLNGANPGVAAYDHATLPIGTHSMVADYLGGEGYNAKTSNTLNHTVNKANTSTTLAATTPNPSSVGQEVTLNATVAVVSPGAGTPTGAIQFLDGAAPLGAPVALAGNAATMKIKALGGGSHSITARYVGDSNFNPSASTPRAHTVACDRVVSNVQGNYNAPASGTTCITGTVTGNVMVPAGATLSITNSTIGGQLMSTSGGGALLVCGSSIAGLTVTGNIGPVVVGSPNEAGCTGNDIASNVRLSSNRGGVTFGGNTVGGTLQCSDNSPAATNGGRPNTVRGSRTGECAAAGF